jgi:hypothetical protein
VGEVVNEEARALAVTGDFEDIRRLFEEFREIQVAHREEMRRLLRDYDSTEEDMPAQLDRYNDLKKQRLEAVQALFESIEASMTDAEQKAMESEIRHLMKSLIALTSAP